MAKDSVINIRTDLETKKAIESLYSQFGITISDAVNIFFRKSLMEGGLPFDMRQPRDIVSGKIEMQPQNVDSFFEEMGV